MPSRKITLQEEIDPVLEGLTEKQRAFCLAKAFGGMTDVDACRSAGYSIDEAGRNAVYRLAHNPAVREAIHALSKFAFRGLVPQALKVVEQIMFDPEASKRDRLKAAEIIFGRGGFPVASEAHMTIEHTHLSDDQKDREILRLARELGLDEASAQKMLISPSDFAKNSQGIYEVQKAERDPATLSPTTVRVRRHRARTPEQRAEAKQQLREQMKAEYAEHQARIAEANAVTDAEYVDYPPIR